jgi:hypothetical protein
MPNCNLGEKGEVVGSELIEDVVLYYHQMKFLHKEPFVHLNRALVNHVDYTRLTH